MFKKATDVKHADIVKSVAGWLEYCREIGITELPVYGEKGGACPCESRGIEVMFVSGMAFSGKPGEKLNEMIKAMKLSADCVYITNIVKPPCLDEEIKVVSPRVIVALGDEAAIVLTGGGVKEKRGRFNAYRGILVMATYHPATLIQKPEFRKDAWEDLKAVMKELGL